MRIVKIKSTKTARIVLILMLVLDIPLILLSLFFLISYPIALEESFSGIKLLIPIVALAIPANIALAYVIKKEVGGIE